MSVWMAVDGHVSVVDRVLSVLQQLEFVAHLLRGSF